MIDYQIVTQADRDAAANYLISEGYWFIDPFDYITGKMDGTPLVQAFARHRIAHSDGKE